MDVRLDPIVAPGVALDVALDNAHVRVTRPEAD